MKPWKVATYTVISVWLVIVITCISTNLIIALAQQLGFSPWIVLSILITLGSWLTIYLKSRLTPLKNGFTK